MLNSNLNLVTSTPSLGSELMMLGAPAPVLPTSQMTTSATLSGIGSAGLGAGLGASTGKVGALGTEANGGLLSGIGGLEGLSSILQGIGSIGGIVQSMRALNLAKEQLAFQREAYNTNLGNQTKTYNTSLEDRVRSRYVAEGRSTADADSYLANHQL